VSLNLAEISTLGSEKEVLMWALILAALCLAQTDGAEWRTAWQRAKARADLRDRYRHGRIDRDAYIREQFRLLTPQEEADVRRVLDEERKRLIKDAAQLETSFRHFKELNELLAKQRRGPLTEEEQKRLAELQRIAAEELRNGPVPRK
jgi:hypothetical protein